MSATLLVALKVALKFVKEHWRGLLIAAALIVAGLAIRHYGQEQCKRCRAAVIADYKVKFDQEVARNRKREADLIAQRDQVAYDYELKLAEQAENYRNAPGRIGPVRVCVQSSRPAAVSTDPAGVGVDPGGASGDGLPWEAGRDIAPELIELTRLADKQTQQLIACQAYARSVSPPSN